MQNSEKDMAKIKSLYPIGCRQTKANVAYWYKYFNDKFGERFSEMDSIDLLSPEHKKPLPERGRVIYAMIFDEKTFYIGQSICLKKRISQHCYSWVKNINWYPRINWIVIDDKINLDTAERFFIHKYKSILNEISYIKKVDICKKVIEKSKKSDRKINSFNTFFNSK